MDVSPPTAAQQVTRLLGEAQRGERRAAEALLPLVYEQLKELARHRMAGERAGHTLQATALVHEAYLRLVRPEETGGMADPGWAGRAHFFHAAAEAMRRILIDHARSRDSIKRGGAGSGKDADDEAGRGPWQRIAFNVLELADDAVQDPGAILALDELISRLEKEEPHLAEVVRLRFFAGLSVEETAEALNVSPRTIKRDWAFARAWLFRRLDG